MSSSLGVRVGLAIVVAMLTVAPGAQAAIGVDSSKLRAAVTTDAVKTHLRALQKFANQSDGTREASSPGFTKSADYVEAKLKTAGYSVTRQRFPYNFYEELAPPTAVGTSAGFPFTYQDGVDISTMDYSGSGSVSGVVQESNDVLVPLPAGQPDGTSNSGCEDADFAGFTGDIALVQRGTCFFFEKIANAQEAGATAVIVFNEGNSAERQGVDFGQASFPQSVPVIEMSAQAGAALVEFIRAERAAGRTVTMTVTTTTISQTRESENVIADTTRGRTDRTVVIGAHLDSVPEGPGINDNGSGTMAQLETALQLAKLKITPVNRLRFAFWGAEEAGLVGSQFYVDSLTARQAKDIAVNLNFDMVASPNFGRFVYDGDGSDTASLASTGSGVVEDVFNDYFASQGLTTLPTAFDGRSDYNAFINVGIPAGGLFTGAEDIKSPFEAGLFGGTAGTAFDPCYHQACDDIANINDLALDQMSDAIAHGTLAFAQTTSAVTGTDKGSGSGSYDPDYLGPKAIR